MKSNEQYKTFDSTYTLLIVFISLHLIGKKYKKSLNTISIFKGFYFVSIEFG